MPRKPRPLTQDELEQLKDAAGHLLFVFAQAELARERDDPVHNHRGRPFDRKAPLIHHQPITYADRFENPHNLALFGLRPYYPSHWEAGRIQERWDNLFINGKSKVTVKVGRIFEDGRANANTLGSTLEELQQGDTQDRNTGLTTTPLFARRKYHRYRPVFYVRRDRKKCSYCKGKVHDCILFKFHKPVWINENIIELPTSSCLYVTLLKKKGSSPPTLRLHLDRPMTHYDGVNDHVNAIMARWTDVTGEEHDGASDAESDMNALRAGRDLHRFQEPEPFPPAWGAPCLSDEELESDGEKEEDRGIQVIEDCKEYNPDESIYTPFYQSLPDLTMRNPTGQYRHHPIYKDDQDVEHTVGEASRLKSLRDYLKQAGRSKIQNLVPGPAGLSGQLSRWIAENHVANRRNIPAEHYRPRPQIMPRQLYRLSHLPAGQHIFRTRAEVLRRGGYQPRSGWGNVNDQPEDDFLRRAGYVDITTLPRYQRYNAIPATNDQPSPSASEAREDLGGGEDDEDVDNLDQVREKIKEIKAKREKRYNYRRTPLASDADEAAALEYYRQQIQDEQEWSDDNHGLKEKDAADPRQALKSYILSNQSRWQQLDKKFKGKKPGDHDFAPGLNANNTKKREDLWAEHMGSIKWESHVIQQIQRFLAAQDRSNRQRQQLLDLYMRRWRLSRDTRKRQRDDESGDEGEDGRKRSRIDDTDSDPPSPPSLAQSPPTFAPARRQAYGSVPKQARQSSRRIPAKSNRSPKRPQPPSVRPAQAARATQAEASRPSASRPPVLRLRPSAQAVAGPSTAPPRLNQASHRPTHSTPLPPADDDDDLLYDPRYDDPGSAAKSFKESVERAKNRPANPPDPFAELEDPIDDVFQEPSPPAHPRISPLRLGKPKKATGRPTIAGLESELDEMRNRAEEAEDLLEQTEQRLQEAQERVNELESRQMAIVDQARGPTYERMLRAGMISDSVPRQIPRLTLARFAIPVPDVDSNYLLAGYLPSQHTDLVDPLDHNITLDPLPEGELFGLNEPITGEFTAYTSTMRAPDRIPRIHFDLRYHQWVNDTSHFPDPLRLWNDDIAVPAGPHLMRQNHPLAFARPHATDNVRPIPSTYRSVADMIPVVEQSDKDESMDGREGSGEDVKMELEDEEEDEQDDEDEDEDEEEDEEDEEEDADQELSSTA